MPKIDPHRKIIGTFHKTGSVLWQVICQQAEKEGVFRHSRLSGPEFDPRAEVVLSQHAHDTRTLLEKHQAPLQRSDRWVVCLRDPRDLIISAAHYHGVTHEKWCHVPYEQFGGMTYQEKINSYTALADKLRFEMENSAGRAILNMLAMRAVLSGPEAHFVRLEDLLQDTELAAYRACFAHLGFDPGRIVDLLAIAVERSFFSDPKALGRNKHARAGQVAEFKEVFDDALHTAFDAHFPGSLDALGYPAEGCSPKPTTFYANPRSDAQGRLWPARQPKVKGE